MKFIKDHHDIIQVISVHLGAISVTLMNVENILKITSLLLAIGYTCWKWYNDYKKNKKP